MKISGFLVISVLNLTSCGKKTLVPSTVVEMDNAKFVYRGIENSLEIAVPGAKSFSISAPGLRESGKPGYYKWNTTAITGTTAILDFEIVTDSVYHIKEIFQVIKIPDMIATLNNRGCKSCIIELIKDEVKETKIGVSIDPILDSRLHPMRVKQYTLVLPDGNRYTVYQNVFSESAQKMIVQFEYGSIFEITDIEYTTHGYSCAIPKLKFMLVEKY